MSAGLARLIGPSDARRRQVEAALLFAEAKNGYIAGEDLLTLMPGLFEPKEVEFLMLELRNAGGLKEVVRERKGALADRYTVRPQRLRETLALAHGFAQGVAHVERLNQAKATTLEIVATLPQGLPLPPGAPAPVPLAAALHQLVVGAEQSLVILNPFFESNGLRFLHGALIAAAQRGVSITVITRDLEIANAPNRLALLELRRELAAAGVANRLTLYNYQVVEEGKMIYLHAKVALADTKAAYVGSANLTQYGLGRHLEVGVLLTGGKVATFSGMIEALLTSEIATKIDL